MKHIPQKTALSASPVAADPARSVGSALEAVGTDGIERWVEMCILATYTEGSATGQCRLFVEWSDDNSNWFAPVDLSASQTDLPVGTGKWVVKVDVPAKNACRYVRFSASEIGDTGTPGNILLELEASVDGG